TAEAMGLAAAIEYATALGFDRISAHEEAVLTYATERLADIPGLRIIGTARKKASIISFVLESAHPHDVGTVLDESGVAVRAGHHCAQPLMERFGIAGTARASFGLYNGFDDVDQLVGRLRLVKATFGCCRICPNSTRGSSATTAGPPGTSGGRTAAIARQRATILCAATRWPYSSRSRTGKSPTSAFRDVAAPSPWPRPR